MNNTEIVLSQEYLIAKGGERLCFVHPDDNKKVIKVVYSNGIHNNQNELEFNYYAFLKKRKVDFSHLVQCYGYIETSEGKGLVFDRVMDYDGEASNSFRYYLANKLISLNEQKKLLEEFRLYLEKNLILFVDTSLTNIFAQKISDNQFKIIIVDGLGAKRTGIKFLFYKYSKIYTQYKIKKQWKKFMTMYEKDIQRSALGQRPFTRL
jgi:hypothetical protein